MYWPIFIARHSKSLILSVSTLNLAVASHRNTTSSYERQLISKVALEKFYTKVHLFFLFL